MNLGQYGSLKRLLLALQQSPTLQGCSVIYGEENINAQDIATPAVVIVPTGGPYSPGVGYDKDVSTEIDMIWNIQETIDLYCWDHASQSDSAIDHVDATENLRTRVLQALWFQRTSGLYFVPTSERWARMQDQQSRYGRALVISVRMDVTVAGAMPTEVTLRSVELQPTIIEG